MPFTRAIHGVKSWGYTGGTAGSSNSHFVVHYEYYYDSTTLSIRSRTTWCFALPRTCLFCDKLFLFLLQIHISLPPPCCGHDASAPGVFATTRPVHHHRRCLLTGSGEGHGHVVHGVFCSLTSSFRLFLKQCFVFCSLNNNACDEQTRNLTKSRPSKEGLNEPNARKQYRACTGLG